MKNMFGKILGFDRMYENKIFFAFFLNRIINSKIWSFFGFCKNF
jgi:hypothetical protein